VTRPAAPPPGAPADWLGAFVQRSNEYAVISVSLDGLINGWHGAAQRLFGYRDAEILGQPFGVLFIRYDVDKRIPQVELELARRSGRSEDDRWHVRKNGSRFWSNGVVNPHIDAGGVHIGYVKLLRDRTDIRMRYEALQSRSERLRSEVKSQREGLLTLIHELRNPLAPILNAARLVSGDASDDMKARMLGVIMRQTEVMQRLLEGAAQQAAPEVRERLAVRSIVLQDALGAAVDGLQPDAAAKGLALSLVCPREPVAIEVDPPRLQQMVLNLLSNAIKYTPGGGHVTVSATVEGDMAVIRVDDDGEGIAQEDLERVFELFTRGDDIPPVPGFGVGLAVVQHLAWLHGGFVEARSPGKGLGSQFVLQLPRKRGAP
jgi:PAS domain S-box-containing protein